jgi:hypothetical protein
MKKLSLKKFIILCILLVILCASILLYSRFIGTRGINIKEYRLNYSELSDSLYGLKIVHFSDLYYSSSTKLETLENLVKKINLTKPDIVIFTGDLINKDYNLSDEEKEKLINILSNINANIGKYQIKGENDTNKDYDSIMENSGFQSINDTYDFIYMNSSSYIAIVGMSSNYENHSTKTLKEKLENSLNKINEQEIKPNYVILAMHEADFIDKIDITPYNLILAGHNLNGQIRLPLIGGIIKIKYGSKYLDSYYLKDNTSIYISNGLGVNDINFRLFNRPSFNLYRLTK